MKVLRSLAALQADRAELRSRGACVALVPTMGNLHAGHLDLVRQAAERADRVVASIYVNPTQFGPDEDYASYPRTLEADLAALEAAGCHRVWLPDDAIMYPVGRDRAVMLRAPTDLADTLCGRVRPGHFDGVVTVVARLFNQVMPNVAVFGEKDYQQLLIIRRLVLDLAFSVDIVAAPTVREADGLAMSSRNRYLDAGQRRRAGCLNIRLRELSQAVRQAASDYRVLAERTRAKLEADGLKPEYVAVRRAWDLGEPEPDPDPDHVLRVLAAVRIGPARLIDNFAV